MFFFSMLVSVKNMSSSAQGEWRPHKPAVNFTPGEGIDIYGNTITNTGVLSLDGPGIDNTNPSRPVFRGVQSVVAGTNVAVDNTDPANPVVSASGSGIGGVDSLTATLPIVVSSSTGNVTVSAPTATTQVAAGTGISTAVDGTGHIWTVTNTAPAPTDTVTTLVAGTGISVTQDTPSQWTITNTAPGGAAGITSYGEITYQDYTSFTPGTGTAITTGGGWATINPVTALTSGAVDFDMPGNGRLRYTGGTTKSFLVNAHVTYRQAGVANNTVFTLYVNSTRQTGIADVTTGTGTMISTGTKKFLSLATNDVVTYRAAGTDPTVFVLVLNAIAISG